MAHDDVQDDLIWSTHHLPVKYSDLQKRTGKEYPDLIVRQEMLEDSGLPYIIENVVYGSLKDPICMCGSSQG